jgi:hypothetical protein
LSSHSCRVGAVKSEKSFCSLLSAILLYYKQCLFLCQIACKVTNFCLEGQIYATYSSTLWC